MPWPPTRPRPDAYLTAIAEPAPLYRQKGWLHPALLLEGANRVLTASVVLPAWLARGDGSRAPPGGRRG